MFPTFLAVPVVVSVPAVVGFLAVVASSVLLLACNEHRSYQYDPIRSKMNVVRFRTIRTVRKGTMTYRQKKYTKKLDIKKKPIVW